MARLVPLVVLLGACNNPCQAVCVEMARYADECGLAVSKDSILLCKESQAEATEAELESCAGWSDPNSLREWWTCEDLAENYADGGGAATGSD